MEILDPYRLPDDLLEWGWSMQQVKHGPRKNPGKWVQFIFHRWHGLAAGDDQLAPNDPVLRVKVRLPTVEEAFTEAIHRMREISAGLTRSPDYQERYAAVRRLAEIRRRGATAWPGPTQPSAEHADEGAP